MASGEKGAGQVAAQGEADGKVSAARAHGRGFGNHPGGAGRRSEGLRPVEITREVRQMPMPRPDANDDKETRGACRVGGSAETLGHHPRGDAPARGRESYR